MLLLRALRNNLLGVLFVVAVYSANGMLFGRVIPTQFEGYSFLGFNVLCALIIGTWIAVSAHTRAR